MSYTQVYDNFQCNRCKEWVDPLDMDEHDKICKGDPEPDDECCKKCGKPLTDSCGACEE